MDADFSNLADDFFVNLSLQTTLPLPRSRETVLSYFEAVQKRFPTMASFYQREGGEYVLEGDREAGSYRWLELQTHQLSAGHFNPPDVAEAYELHEWLLDRCVYFLGISGLDVEALDVMFGFNMDFRGNRDAIVADALLGGSPLMAMLGEPSVRALECEPNFVVSLDEDCYVQARLSVETRSSSYQVRTGQYDDEPISVYFTVRRYPSPGGVMNLAEAFAAQAEACEDLVSRIVVPHVIQPIAAAIASSR
ncbi:MAG TPA: hypothetical protein VM695_10620 [Phycisphaerae bacterium]|nr:hypothetical protein [Phycisphaerae bacterium]